MASSNESDQGALEHQREVWRKQASRYDREMSFWERVLFEDARASVCSRARGDVLEVAIGTGRNLDYYPEDVTLVGVDLVQEMLTIARERMARLDRAVDLLERDVLALSFPDNTFDRVVCPFALCNIPNVPKALAEMRRVLRSDGRLLLVDHVASSNRVALAVQQILEKFTVRFQGEHLTRRPLPLVLEAGFVIDEQRRFNLGIVELVVAHPLT